MIYADYALQVGRRKSPNTWVQFLESAIPLPAGCPGYNEGQEFALLSVRTLAI